MRTRILTAIFTTMLLRIPPSRAQRPEQLAPDVTIRATIISLPNAEATLFSTKQDLSGKPAEALNALENLVAHKQANPAANLAVTTKSGQTATSTSKDMTLRVEPVVSPDGGVIDISIDVHDKDQEIATSFVISNGGAKFLGSVQKPADKTMTDYIFVRVSCVYSRFVPSVHATGASVRANEPSRFGKVDDDTVLGRFIDVDLDAKTRARLYFTYVRIDDSGAELELVAGGKAVWQQYVQPIGVMAHSVYGQEVQVRMTEDDKSAFEVRIMGLWNVYERRDLKTGKLLTRKKL